MKFQTIDATTIQIGDAVVDLKQPDNLAAIFAALVDHINILEAEREEEAGEQDQEHPVAAHEVEPVLRNLPKHIAASYKDALKSVKPHLQGKALLNMVKAYNDQQLDTAMALTGDIQDVNLLNRQITNKALTLTRILDNAKQDLLKPLIQAEVNSKVKALETKLSAKAFIKADDAFKAQVEILKSIDNDTFDLALSIQAAKEGKQIAVEDQRKAIAAARQLLG